MACRTGSPERAALRGGHRSQKKCLTDYPYKDYFILVMGKLRDEIKQTKPFGSLEDEAFLNVIRTAERFLWREAEFLKPYEITLSQYNVLRILRGAEPEGLICREISERMIARDPDVTKLLDRLEARGLVKRERQENDRRVIIVRVTPEGVKLVDEIDRPALKMTEELLGHLGERKLKTLIGLLEEAREGLT
jgi:DNA-binding MarR family transcriptional regulator